MEDRKFINKSITIESDLLKKAQKEADHVARGNFSFFISKLIEKYFQSKKGAQ